MATKATSRPAATEQIRCHIRWMIRRDMPEVLRIEGDSFELAWTEEDFLRTLRQRDRICMIAELGEKVVGFFVYELREKEVEILNMAVAPAFRRAGVGWQMVAKLLAKLSIHRRTRALLRVRETNLDAQLFFRSCGFKATRVLRGYYESDSGEDAYLFVRRHEGDREESQDDDGNF